MFDADNDGMNDIYVCNGIYKDLIRSLLTFCQRYNSENGNDW